MLYKLLIYLNRNGVFLIDTIFGEEEELVRIAQERKSNNPEFFAVILTYNATSIKMV